jgi:hypothetical protein
VSYFAHSYISNSDLKEIVRRHNGIPKMEGLQEVFDFGSEFHAGILEPHKSDLSRIKAEDQELIKVMSKTFWKDEMCRKIAMAHDFRREHEFYRVNRFGFEGVRCKADGDSRALQVCLELKGLKVATQKAFEEAILFHSYDQASAWYLDVMTGTWHYKYQLVIGISKIYPDRPPFKLLVDRNHTNYKTGLHKIKSSSLIARQYGLK